MSKGSKLDFWTCEPNIFQRRCVIVCFLFPLSCSAESNEYHLDEWASAIFCFSWLRFCLSRREENNYQTLLYQVRHISLIPSSLFKFVWTFKQSSKSWIWLFLNISTRIVPRWTTFTVLKKIKEQIQTKNKFNFEHFL